MENKGNKARGIILLLFTVLLSAWILYGAISIALSKDLETWGYKDPVVSDSNIRGTIYDRNGKIIAISVPQYGFEIINGRGSAQHISSVIYSFTDYNPVYLASLIKDGLSFVPASNGQYVTSPEFLDIFLKDADIDHMVSFTRKEVRKYPYGIMENIIGFSPSPSSGEGGIEEMFNSYLMAYPEIDHKSVYGSSLTLTIDTEMEMVLEKTMEDLMIEGNAAIYSKSGEILAYKGEADESVVASLVKTITTPTNLKEERSIRLPDTFLDALSLGPYFFYHDGDRSEILRKSLEKVLKESGKI